MNLTLTDKAEIKRIIAGLGDADMKHIKAETERLAASCSPLFDMLESHKPDDFTKAAINWISEDDEDAREDAGTLIYDALLLRVKAEYALSVFANRHRMEDAA